jgi:hypothetical protein
MKEDGSSMSYARVNTTIVLRGHKFPAGTLIRVWETGRVTSVQPIATSHHALWYALPQMHRRHIVPLDRVECDLFDYGIL